MRGKEGLNCVPFHSSLGAKRMTNSWLVCKAHLRARSSLCFLKRTLELEAFGGLGSLSFRRFPPISESSPPFPVLSLEFQAGFGRHCVNMIFEIVQTLKRVIDRFFTRIGLSLWNGIFLEERQNNSLTRNILYCSFCPVRIFYYIEKILLLGVGVSNNARCVMVVVAYMMTIFGKARTLAESVSNHCAAFICCLSHILEDVVYVFSPPHRCEGVRSPILEKAQNLPLCSSSTIQTLSCQLHPTRPLLGVVSLYNTTLRLVSMEPMFLNMVSKGSSLVKEKFSFFDYAPTGVSNWQLETGVIIHARCFGQLDAAPVGYPLD